MHKNGFAKPDFEIEFFAAPKNRNKAMLDRENFTAVVNRGSAEHYFGGATASETMAKASAFIASAYTEKK